jgi:hypothetical protein
MLIVGESGDLETKNYRKRPSYLRFTFRKGEHKTHTAEVPRRKMWRIGILSKKPRIWP